MRSSLTIRLAGDAGDSIQLMGQRLAHSAALQGHTIYTSYKPSPAFSSAQGAHSARGFDRAFDYLGGLPFGFVLGLSGLLPFRLSSYVDTQRVGCVGPLGILGHSPFSVCVMRFGAAFGLPIAPTSALFLFACRSRWSRPATAHLEIANLIAIWV